MKRRVFLAAAAGAMAPMELDLFLLVGQSNMAGRGDVEAQDRTPIDGVFALNKDLTWQPAVDPLHWDKPIAAVGLGRSFAATLKKYGAAGQIGLIPAAFGGTSLEEWKPGGRLFSDAITRARAAAPVGRLRGILWHPTAPLWMKRTGFVSSAGLGHKGDEVHFDSAGLRELGRRYALAWMAL